MFARKMTKCIQRQVISILIMGMFVLSMTILLTGCDSLNPISVGSSHTTATSQPVETTVNSTSPTEGSLKTEPHSVSASNSSTDETSSQTSTGTKTSDKLLVPLIALLLLFIVVFFPLILYVLVRLKRCEKLSDRNIRLFDQTRDKQKSSASNSQNINSFANGSLNNLWNNQLEYITRSEYENLEKKVNRFLTNSNQNAVPQTQEQQANPAIVNQSTLRPNNQSNRSANASVISQSKEDLKRIFNQYGQFSEQEISQIQKTFNFVSMRVEQYVTGALSSAALSDSNDKDARYLRPANPSNADGQFYVIPNPTNKNYTEIELGYIASLFDVPGQMYQGNRPIKLLNPAVITRSGKAFSLIQKGQIEFL